MMPPPSGTDRGSRTRNWVSKVALRPAALLAVLAVVCDPAGAISYRKDTGFATDGVDQFVFRESAGVSSSSGVGTVKRSGRVRFMDSAGYSGAGDSFQSASGPTPSYNRGTVESVGAGGSGGFFGAGASTSGSPFPQRDHQERDQFYTVGASIQLAGSSGGDTITPPPPVETQPKPKRKKNKYRFSANEKVYNADAQDHGSFAGSYAGAVGGGQHRYPGSLQDNYLTSGGRPLGGQFDNSITNYPELQKHQYPFSVNSPAQGGSPYYFTGGQQGVNGGTFNSPYQYQYPISPSYVPDYPTQQAYQQPGGGFPGAYQQPQPAFGVGQPPNAQSILGVLQSIFNFAPGTFGTSPTTGPVRPGSSLYSPAPTSPFVGGVGGQLRQALDNISENDELQCVPKLICMMSRSSTGQGFSIVNRGLLSTILGAVPDSSPWLKFSRAALLGYGIGANSCDAYYPKCPKDEMEILYYLNNHRGGFFRFFSNGEQGQYQQQQQQQYG